MYDYKQISLAYKIVMYRKMGLSLSKIRERLAPASTSDGFSMMEQQLQELEGQIAELQQQKYNILVYQDAMRRYGNRKSGSEFSIEQMEVEPLLVLPSLESLHGTATTMNQFLMHCRESGIRIDCHIGRCFSTSLTSERDWHMADSIYFKKLDGSAEKAAGRYLVYTTFTDGSDINEVYARLFTYMKKHGLRVAGRIYEDYPLSGIFASDRNVHLIRIMAAL